MSALSAFRKGHVPLGALSAVLATSINSGQIAQKPKFARLEWPLPVLLITTSKSSDLSEHAVKMAHRYFEIPIPMSLAGGLCGFLSLLALFVILLSKKKVAAVREIALVSLAVIAEKLGALQQERTRTVLIKAKSQEET